MKPLLVAFMLAMAGAAPACSSPTEQEASPGTGGDVTIGAASPAPYRDDGDTMAKSLARSENISLTEARRRMVLQHEVSVLGNKLRAAYGPQFAGAMIERRPAFLAKFYFIGVDLAKVREGLPGMGVSADLLPLIRLERAAQTEAQQRATAEQMRQALRAAGVDASVAFSMTGYRIFTLEPEKAAEALRAGGVTAAGKVEFVRSAPIVITPA